jgi:ABC-type multidrug transport system fused ATPase/permease subunit
MFLLKNLLKILKYARPYWGYLLIAGVSLLLVTAINLVAPMLIRSLVALLNNSTYGPEEIPTLLSRIKTLALLLGLAYLARTVFTFFHRYLAHLAAWNLVADMRSRVYSHLQGLSLRYYHQRQTGELMSRTANDPATFEVLIAHAVPDLIVNLLIFAGVSIILFRLNPFLALCALLPVPFMFLAGIGFTKRVLPNFRQAQRQLAEFNAVLQDNLSGMKEIQVFNQQEREFGRVRTGARNHAATLLHALKLSAIFHPVIEFFSSFGNVIVVGIGGVMALKGLLPLEDVVGFLLYLGIFYQPIGALARVLEDLQQALAGAERVFEVLKEEPDVKEKKHPVVLKKVEGKITFDRVSFRYNKDGEDVLKDISFTVNPREMLAIVGPTGVGKSTLVSLIPRFYDPTAGRVLIDVIDIRDVSLFSLRNQISMVLQDVFLFNGTIAENIAYSSRNATMAEIEAAARAAYAHDFIMAMPGGYDSYIGERGVKLSGGQKQRLSIARAILRNAPILILDEATASVDVETERQIQQAIDNLVKDRTIIVIAHRLSTVEKADRIIYLQDGVIAESGTHEELMAKKGLYYNWHMV